MGVRFGVGQRVGRRGFAGVSVSGQDAALAAVIYLVVIVGLVGGAIYAAFWVLKTLWPLWAAAGVLAVVLLIVRALRRRAREEEHRLWRERVSDYRRLLAAAARTLDADRIEKQIAATREAGLADYLGKAVEVAEGVRDVARMKDELAAGLPAPVTLADDRIVNGEPCYFTAPALYDKRGPNDERGRVYFASDEMVFHGAGLQRTPWKRVINVRRDDLRAVCVQPANRQTPIRFVFDTYSDALRANILAEALALKAQQRPLQIPLDVGADIAEHIA